MLRSLHFYKKLSPVEKNTFFLHLMYSLIEGIVLGVVVLNEFVFVKSLKGSGYNLSLLFQFSVLALLFSIFLNEFLKRYRNKRKLLRVVALVTRLPLLIMAFFPSNIAIISANIGYHYLFLAIFMVYYLAQPVVLPLINLILKANYLKENFGKLYSYATMSNKIIMLVTTFFFGMILDIDYAAFRYVYPIIGILGIISIHLLSSLRVMPDSDITPGRNMYHTFRQSLQNAWMILKNNKAYRDFEIGFMFYGIAFMSSAVIITIYFDRALHLNYSSAAFYKNFYNIIAILLLPVFGRLIGKLDPRKFSIMTYSFMAANIFFIALTEYFPLMREFAGIKFFLFLVTGYTFYGFFAASMPLLWDIGASYFCSSEEASDYQAIHLTLTGVRGLFAPLVGITLYQATNFLSTYLLSLASLVVAIIIMYFSLKKTELPVISIKQHRVNQVVQNES
jgi:Na+/melibiose symporter-like transporter